MNKLSYEDEIEIYNQRQEVKLAVYLYKKYNVKWEKINYLIRIIDKHGFGILRKNNNQHFTREEKN